MSSPINSIKRKISVRRLSPSIGLTKNQLNQLRSSKKDKIDTSLDGYVTYAKCVDVYDGDTCRLKFFRNGVVVQHSVRLDKIDAPEIKPKKIGRTLESLEKEKEAAIKSKNRLREFILCDELVHVTFGKNEKYGRPLVAIRSFDEKIDINMQMVREGHAVLYDGGKKQQLF